jgi:hypothetical protein
MQSRRKGVATVISAQQAGNRISVAGAVVLRYGLVVVIAWIGALKFTAWFLTIVANPDRDGDPHAEVRVEQDAHGGQTPLLPADPDGDVGSDGR